ncbi:scarecrow-like protein 6 [Arachis duranensis]|uniref:Scarecrow-like protein 6 n=1 Tax=Arachis duranensis TaxID=130453 RepID=A0A6P4CGI1_ARADU|nr:scarecrow-like protein 6 [Arachis duranensis]
MKAMPFPSEEFQGKGVLDFSSSYCSATDLFSLLQHQQQLVNNHSIHQPPPPPQEEEEKWRRREEEEEEENKGYVGCTEPTSVLDSRRSQSPPSSSCTMSSSLGSSNNSTSKGSAGGGGGGGCSASAAALTSENPPPPPEGSMEKCGGTRMMDDWEGQDQSILRLIMGDVEDPSAGLTKLLQTGSHNVDFSSGGFGVVDQGGLIMDPSVPGNYPAFPFLGAENTDGHIAKTGGVAEPMFSSGNNPMLASTSPAAGVFGSQQPVFGIVDEKPQVINPQFMMNHNQVQFSENPSFFVPLTYPQMQEQHVVYSQQPAKRPLSDATVGHNYQVPRLPLLDSGQEQFARRQQQAQLPLFPHHSQQQKVSSAGDEASNQLQQAMFDQLYKTAELIEAGNPVLAQGILARLNHQLSPIGKPFQRAALYMKEALQLLPHSNISNLTAFSPISFIFKVGAYKSFSEISPVLQFANFTSNQALIEAVERFDRIHIIDFDIGFGVQWSSFMQELALRNSGASSLRVTAVVSPSTCDEVELSFTRENLSQYAKDINLSFELHILNIESLSSPSFPLAGQFFDNEAVAVNMPLSCFTHHPSLVPSVLHFVKQLSPKVVVTLGRNCDRNDVPLPTKVVHVLQYYSALLESLDAVNVNLDVLQKIEKHFIQPSIRKVIVGHHHYHSQEKLPHWRNLFAQSGFSSFTFSNFTEAQAECLVQRAPVRGFQVDRNHSSLVLCWQRKDLVSISLWRC